MSKSILIVWAPGHCGLSDNELADHQAKLGETETLPDSALTAATLWDVIRRSCHPPPIQHEQLKEVYTSLPQEQNKKPFAKIEHIDWALIRSGHQPALRCWQHLARISEDAICQLCGRKSTLHNTYGYDVWRFRWKDNIATLVIQWTNWSAFHVQL